VLNAKYMTLLKGGQFLMKKGLLTTLLAAMASVSGIQSVYASAPVINPLPNVTIGDAENNGVTDNNYFVYTNAFKFDSYAYDTDGTPPAQLLWSFIEGSGTPAGQWFQVNGKNPIANVSEAQRPDLVANGSPTGSGGSKNLRETNADGYDHSWASFRDIVLSPGWGPLTTGFAAQPTVASQHAVGKPVSFFVSDGTNVATRDIFVKTVDNASDAVSAPSSYTKKRDDQFTTGSTWWGKMQAGSTNLTYDGNTGSVRVFVSSGTGNARILGWEESEYWKTQIDGANFPVANELKYGEVGATNWIRAKFHAFVQASDGSANVTDLHQAPSIRARISGPLFSIGMFTDINPHRNGDSITDNYAFDMSPTTSSANARVYRVDFDPPEYSWTTANSPNGTLALFGSYVDNPNKLGFARMFEAFARGGDTQEQGFLCLAESSIGIYPSQNAAMTNLLTFNQAADWTTVSTGTTVPGAQFEGAVVEQAPGGIITTELGYHSTAAPSRGDGAADVTGTGSASGFSMSTIAVDSRSDPDGAGKYATASVNWYWGTAATGANTATHVRAMPGTLYRARFTAGATVASSVQAMVRFRVQAINSSFNSRLEVGGATGGTEFSWGLLPGTGSTFATGAGNSGVYDVIFATPFDINPTDMAKTAPDSSGGYFHHHIGELQPQGVADVSLLSFWREISPGADIIDEYIADAAKSATSDKGQMTISNIVIQSAPAVGE